MNSKHVWSMSEQYASLDEWAQFGQSIVDADISQ